MIHRLCGMLEHKEYITDALKTNVMKREYAASAKAAVSTVRKHGHKAVICTGRSRAETVADIAVEDFDGFVCSSGAYVGVDGSVLHSQPLAVSLITPYAKS